MGDNQIIVQVNTADLTNYRNYIVTITRQAASSNNNLSALTAQSAASAGGTYSGLTLNPSTFSAATTAYTATVPNATSHVKLTPTVADTGKATVQVGKGTSLASVNSGSASAAIELSVGANPITVRVTAEDSSTRDYTITITRRAAGNLSSNNNLSGLVLQGAKSAGGAYSSLTLTPANGVGFQASVTSYTATVPNSITHVKLTPTVADTGATVQVGKAASLASVNSGSGQRRHRTQRGCQRHHRAGDRREQQHQGLHRHRHLADRVLGPLDANAQDKGLGRREVGLRQRRQRRRVQLRSRA